MAADIPRYPFQVSEDQLEAELDLLAAATVLSLSSFYLELPRGSSFLEYAEFRKAYEELRLATADFKTLDRHAIHEAFKKNGMVLVLLRCIVGLTPPELADMALDLTAVTIDQNFARSQDQKARQGKNILESASADAEKKLLALVDAACAAIEAGPASPNPLLIHRLFKVDTAEGLASVKTAADTGIEYPALLYERMLGRPFATHRDSVSGLVGDIVEQAVIDELETAKIPYYQTKRAEAIPGFDQAPDFFIPSKENPKVVIEAKLTQDDGTARDKVTRVQHLDTLSEQGRKYEVIACIDGRGFKIRRQDMKKLIRATRGKVFTVSTMAHLVQSTSLKDFAGQAS